METTATTALACAAALSTKERTFDALAEAAAAARESLGGPADLALLFASPHHGEAADKLAARACELVGTKNLIGCTGEAIVGTGREVEEAPVLSLWLARWPGVRLSPMHLQFKR